MENLRELVRNNGDLVNYLLTNAFNKLSYDDKVFVKHLDRPTPSLNSLVNTNKNSYNRKFIPGVPTVWQSIFTKLI
jgi:hypothetical protein